jgi:hypothetical protein
MWQTIKSFRKIHQNSCHITIIKHGQFPNRLKEAQVVPLHKKNDPLDKKNYRPVSILPTISNGI